MAATVEGVRHRTVEANGVRLHVAEAGPEEAGAPVVLLVHGFPDLWYGWRHQMAALAARGYRAVAPDLRGYGDSDSPPDASSYTTFHVVGDLVLGVDGLDRTLRLARPAVNALLGVDHELIPTVIDAVHRTDLDARLVLGTDTGLRNDVGHLFSLLPLGQPIAPFYTQFVLLPQFVLLHLGLAT